MTPSPGCRTTPPVRPAATSRRRATRSINGRIGSVASRPHGADLPDRSRGSPAHSRGRYGEGRGASCFRLRGRNPTDRGATRNAVSATSGLSLAAFLSRPFSPSLGRCTANPLARKPDSTPRTRGRKDENGPCDTSADLTFSFKSIRGILTRYASTETRHFLTTHADPLPPRRLP
jgi:hypothetical protein